MTGLLTLRTLGNNVVLGSGAATGLGAAKAVVARAATVARRRVVNCILAFVLGGLFRGRFGYDDDEIDDSDDVHMSFRGLDISTSFHQAVFVLRISRRE